MALEVHVPLRVLVHTPSLFCFVFFFSSLIYYGIAALAAISFVLKKNGPCEV